jgi:predicted transcriptional regulator
MSTQVNVRLDEELLGEIDILTKVLHISRTEWLRTTIARAVKEDTLNLKEAIAMEYAKGRISDEELKDLLGADSEDVKFIVRQVRKGKRTIDDMVEKGLL